MKNNSIEKNKEYEVEIIDNGFEGEGIAKINDFTIFVQGALKGEKVKILIVKVFTSYAFGKLLEIIKKSKFRIEPDCGTYKRCGGCNLRHVDYEESLNIKRDAVQSLVNKYLKNNIKIENTWGMGNPYNYRNKLEFPIGVNEKNEPIIGVFANRTHKIIPIERCMIQNEESEEIAKYSLNLIKKYNISIYNEITQKGIMRHIVIKKAFVTNQIMVIFVINSNFLPNSKEIALELKQMYPTIKTVITNINKDNTNVVLGNKNVFILGKGYIEDVLGNYLFKISPNSFYQVNPVQAEAIYNYVIEKAEISNNDIVFDLYCGIGTISIFLANLAKKVYGVEIVKEAVEMANKNAKSNSIKNVEFIAGDTEIVLDDLIKNKKIFPDLIIVDPPRKGLDSVTIETIRKIKSKKIVYISCNPASLVRDLSKMEDLYSVKVIQPFDMFPFTHHVECVSVLELKESTEK